MPALRLRLAALLFPTAVAVPAAAAEVTTFALANGMEVVVIEDHRVPAVTHMVWYRAGSADEGRGHSGVAHFLEHLMFKGTDEMGPNEFSRMVEANGGSDNAFTSQDYTAYFQRVAADRLEPVMRMEADRMRDLVLSEGDVETEREVILEERAQRTDSDPGALFSEQMTAAQYLNHPYGTPIIGWRQEMAALTRQDALDWYRLYYAPNNAILVVAGDVAPETVRRLAETYYGPIAASPGLAARRRPQEPPQLAARRLDFTDARVAQPYLMRSYLAPERDPGDQRKAAALRFLAEILGGDGQTSVLAQRLQFAEQKAIHSSAWYDGVSLDATTFDLSLMPAPGVSLAEAEAALDAALAEFLAGGIDPGQFARIKTRMRAAEVYALDHVDQLARRYGAALASGLTVADVEAWPDVLQSVTPDEVMAAAHALFDRRQAVTGWMQRPAEPEPTFAVQPAAPPSAGATEVIQ